MEEQYHICALSKPANDALKIVAALARLELRICRRCRGRHGGVNHTRAVDEEHILNLEAGAGLELQLVYQGRTKEAQAGKPERCITNECGAVLVRITRRAVANKREPVVGRSDARFLHLLAAHVVDKAALPGRMISQDKHHGQGDELVARLLQRAQEARVQWSEYRLV